MDGTFEGWAGLQNCADLVRLQARLPFSSLCYTGPMFLSAQDAASELMRRKRARESLPAFALSVDIPTVAREACKPDESIAGRSEDIMAKHHGVILKFIQNVITKPMGRGIIVAPPGSAKSIYTSVLAPAWFMGNNDKVDVMLASYAENLSEMQSRRAMEVVQQENYAEVFAPKDVSLCKDAAKEWNLANGSHYRAVGFGGGATGKRADLLIVDDPISKREEADNKDQRDKIYAAFKDDLMSRLKANAKVLMVMTRWHEDDPVGRLVGEHWKGENGPWLCTDGQIWDILVIRAKCEDVDDPIGRKLGEYLWPQNFPESHWKQYEIGTGMDAARTWNSLYQGRPTAQGSGRFLREMFRWYDGADELPQRMYMLGASDHGVTQGGGDFSEAGVWGMDPDGNLYMLHWWNSQVDPDTSCCEVLDIVERFGTPMWFNEGGNIDKVMRPLFNREIKDRHKKGRRAYVDIRALPSMKDKIAKVASFQGRCATGCVFFPKRNPHSERIIDQLISMPGGKYDDAADVCGLIGRALDQFHPTDFTPRQRAPGLIPFTQAWVEYSDKSEKPAIRYT